MKIISAIKLPSVELNFLESKSDFVYNLSEKPIMLSKLMSIESL